MVFPLRALQVAASPGVAGWLSSPYFYAFLAAGCSSMIFIQAAYKDGEMAAVAPALYGMQVLWPALASYFVFGAKFLPVADDRLRLSRGLRRRHRGNASDRRLHRPRRARGGGALSFIPV